MSILKVESSLMLRQKKIMSQSCCLHLFFGARLIQQNSCFKIFVPFLFFFLKIYIKRYNRYNKTYGTAKFLL